MEFDTSSSILRSLIPTVRAVTFTPASLTSLSLLALKSSLNPYLDSRSVSQVVGTSSLSTQKHCMSLM